MPCVAFGSDGERGFNGQRTNSTFKIRGKLALNRNAFRRLFVQWRRDHRVRVDLPHLYATVAHRVVDASVVDASECEDFRKPLFVRVRADVLAFFGQIFWCQKAADL